MKNRNQVDKTWDLNLVWVSERQGTSCSWAVEDFWEDTKAMCSSSQPAPTYLHPGATGLDLEAWCKCNIGPWIGTTLGTWGGELGGWAIGSTQRGGGNVEG